MEAKLAMIFKFLFLISLQTVLFAQEKPIDTPVFREAMKQSLEDLKKRKPRIILPEITEDEKKQSAQDDKKLSYEYRLKSLYLNSTDLYFLPFSGQSKNKKQKIDPLLSLDYGFKVKLFWICSRANNCHYCLGHQESKLLSCGFNENIISLLDINWEGFPENERVAFELARRLTLEPYSVSDSLINSCRKFYSDSQLIEMICSISGNNAINRWKEGIGVPQSVDGGKFLGEIEHTYLTPTPTEFLNKSSIVINSKSENNCNFIPTHSKRKELNFEQAINEIKKISKRKPRFDLVDIEKTSKLLGIQKTEVEQWHCLLSHFPEAGKKFYVGLCESSKCDKLSEALKNKIDWATSKQDRAWYAAGLSLKKGLISIEDMKILDNDLGKKIYGLDEKDRVILNLCKKLCSSPVTLSDNDVNSAIEIVGNEAVVEAINYCCFRCALNRISECANLSFW
jgi:hypothetical protein